MLVCGQSSSGPQLFHFDVVSGEVVPERALGPPLYVTYDGHVVAAGNTLLALDTQLNKV